MTITRNRLYATLGTTTRGETARVHADGHIWIQGRVGTGKTVTTHALATRFMDAADRRFWGRPAADVIELGFVPRYGWRLALNGKGDHVTSDQADAYLTDLSRIVRSEHPGVKPAVLILDSPRLTNRAVFEAVEGLLRYGSGSNLHLIVAAQPVAGLMTPLRNLCASAVYLNPTRDHEVPDEVTEKAMRAAGVWFADALPSGPGSFIATNDLVSAGTVSPVTTAVRRAA